MRFLALEGGLEMEDVDRLTLKARSALEQAQRQAEEDSKPVTPYHLLLAMVEDPLVTVVLGDDAASLARAQLEEIGPGPVELDPATDEVLTAAEAFADEVDDPFVSVEHLLAAMGGCGILPGHVRDDVVRAVAAQRRVLRVVEEEPKTPLQQLATEELLEMETVLHRRIVGQDRAVTAVSHATRRAVAGLADPHRPFGSFLFLGPTGVGKTELAKALAEFLYGTERLMTRLDMSEYREAHTVAKLIGSPPGYVGYQEGGQLTNAVKQQPQSLVLLDEMEKAHPDVLNVMLQLLDDGRLTSGQGETVDFTECVVVMTSNVGSQLYRSKLGPEELKGAVLEELWSQFRPEFLNRIDEMVVFDSLTKEQFGAICDLQLAPLSERLHGRGITLRVTAGAKTYLVDGGWNPVLGARQMRRFVQREVQDPLAQRLLEHGWRNGTVVVGVGTDGLAFTWKGAR